MDCCLTLDYQACVRSELCPSCLYISIPPLERAQHGSAGLIRRGAFWGCAPAPPTPITPASEPASSLDKQHRERGLELRALDLALRFLPLTFLQTTPIILAGKSHLYILVT